MFVIFFLGTVFVIQSNCFVFMCVYLYVWNCKNETTYELRLCVIIAACNQVPTDPCNSECRSNRVLKMDGWMDGWVAALSERVRQSNEDAPLPLEVKVWVVFAATENKIVLLLASAILTFARQKQEESRAVM